MKTIYFAGCVSANDWRNTFAIEADRRIMSNGYAVYTTNTGGKYKYGGPFAVSDDHGCFHGARHGCGSTSGCAGSYNIDTFNYIEVTNDGQSEGNIFNRCKEQIRSCDAVVANITKPDCYGTYFELGYAAALGKPIFLYCPIVLGRITRDSEHGNDLSGDDLWFIKQSAIMLNTLEIPAELLEFGNKTKYHEYLQTPEWKSIASRKRTQAGNKCQLCNDGTAKLNVHHRTYDNVYREKLDDLIVLCENCHTKFHGTDDHK